MHLNRTFLFYSFFENFFKWISLTATNLIIYSIKLCIAYRKRNVIKELNLGAKTGRSLLFGSSWTSASCRTSFINGTDAIHCKVTGRAVIADEQQAVPLIVCPSTANQIRICPHHLGVMTDFSKIRSRRSMNVKMK